MLGSQRARTRARLRYVGHRRSPPPKTTLAAVTMLTFGMVSMRIAYERAALGSHAHTISMGCAGRWCAGLVCWIASSIYQNNANPTRHTIRPCSSECRQQCAENM